MLAERTAELDELDELLRQCATGRGRAALISGPLAGGKTELLYAFGERVAAEPGTLLLSAAASAAEQQLPWAVMSQLFHSAPLPQPLLDRVLPLLNPAGPVEPVADPDDPATVQTAHALCLALLELSHHRTVVVSIDDVQYADAGSLSALGSLLRRIRAHRVLVLLCAGAPDRRTGADPWAELLRQPHIRTLQVRPLSVDGVAEVLAERWGTPVSAGRAAAVHATTGGNPLLVGALAGELDPTGEDAAPPAGGWAFQHAVLGCLHRGDRRLLAIAQAVAVLGPVCSAPTLGILAGGGTQEAAMDLDILEQAGLLRDGRFRHPAGRQAVLDALGTADRVRLHRRAAQLAREAGAGCEQIAEHLVAGATVEWEWSVPVLVEAAEQALALDRVEHAADCLRLALTGTAEGARRASITALLARAQWRLNPSATVRYLEPLCAAAAQGLLGARELVQLVRYLCWQGRLEAANEVLTRLDALPAGSEPQWLPELRSIYQWLYSSVEPLARQLRRAERVDPRPARRPGSPARPGGPGLTLVFSQETAQEAARLAEQSLRGTVLADHNLETVTLELLAMAHADRAERAAGWCDTLLADATARGAVTWQAQLHAVRAELAVRQGDLPLAARHAGQALELLPRQSWGVAVGAPLGSLLLALVGMGNRDEAGEKLRFVVPDAMFETRFGAQFLRARGHYYLSRGRAHAALGDFQRCGELLTRRGWDAPAFLPWRGDLAQALVDLDRREAARGLVTEQLDRLGSGGGRARGISLRVLASASDLRRRPALLREAVDLLQSCDDRVELATALADLSSTYHHLGEFSRARMMAGRASQLARSVRAEAVCGRLIATQELPEPVDPQQAGTGGVTVLSDAERRVASLAAVGHTNVEISRKLFITVSTVEQHLTRVYRKLKVARRADLPTILHLDAVETA
jgi:DNA-binding CsgD family transcriptional regulator/tetratricopeptide (TPR) repeat protein